MPDPTHAPHTRGQSGSIASRLAAVAAAFVLTRVLPGHGGTEASRVGTPGKAPAQASAREAPVVMRPGWRGWWDRILRIYAEFNDDRILSVAAGVTFYALLALFPAIAAIVSLYGLLSDPSTIGQQLDALSGILPGGALEVIGGQIQRLTSHESGALGFAFFSGLAVSLWSANAGMKAIFDALNIAYDETEKRSFVWLNVVSLAFTLGAVAFIVAALAAVVLLPVLLKFIGFGPVTEWLTWAGRWPALLVVILGLLALLYRYGPSRADAHWRWITPGSVLAAFGWLAFSMLFSWYVGSFGNYNETYGSLGAAIGFLTWLWLSTTIVLVGAELNSDLERYGAAPAGDAPVAREGSAGSPQAGTMPSPARTKKPG